MSTTQFDATIDWTDYWSDADESDRKDAGPAPQYTLEPLLAFLAEWEPPATAADVGCGPGHTPLGIAAEYPAASVLGYDAAAPVLAENRTQATERGLDNVAFEQATLPEFDPEQSFELVTCFHTLVYVEENEQALSALYDAVAPGGHLVFTYHNRFAQRIFESIAENPHEHLGPDAAWDPDRFEQRFELLIEGENLLSYDRIEATLGTRPRSLWSAAPGCERYPAWRQNPLVYVPK